MDSDPSLLFASGSRSDDDCFRVCSSPESRPTEADIEYCEREEKGRNGRQRLLTARAARVHALFVNSAGMLSVVDVKSSHILHLATEFGLIVSCDVEGTVVSDGPRRLVIHEQASHQRSSQDQRS